MLANPRGEMGAILLCSLFLASCRTTPSDRDMRQLVTLRPGATAPAAEAALTGTLVRQGGCLAIDGNGSTVVVWPRPANARATPGGGTVVVIWPFSTALRHGERAGPAGINVVVVWPVSDDTSRPVHLGERVELVGGMKDDILGLALARPLPRSCRGRAFVVREFRPAPAP
jgi:hypothetical protein